MRYGQLADRAHALEQAATFARTLSRYVVELDVDTAGKALERLKASQADAEDRRAKAESHGATLELRGMGEGGGVDCWRGTCLPVRSLRSSRSNSAPSATELWRSRRVWPR